MSRPDWTDARTLGGMAQDEPDHAARREAFRADLDRRLREEAARIDADPDPERAHQAAVDFRDALSGAAGMWAVVRARQAVRVRDAKSLSLAGLAEMIRVSKGRADQLVRLATSTPPPEAAEQQREEA